MGTTKERRQERRREPHRAASGSLTAASRRLWFDFPALMMMVGVLALACYLRALLGAAAAGRSLGLGNLGFWLVVVGFLVTAVTVLVAQCLRMAERIAGPEHRLRCALQRIRSGDVGFRITLRRGDPLQELAHECNELLDWLNENPPTGARTGSDIVEVAEVMEEVAP